MIFIHTLFNRFIVVSAERKYRYTDYTDSNDNCPLASIVVTEDNCKNAATELRRNYKYATTSISAPAGCWENAYGVRFNTITDPRITSPFQGSRGICYREGTEYWLFYILYLSHFFLRRSLSIFLNTIMS